jgi:hypothetical protein
MQNLKKNLPAFLFYVDSWLSSATITLMTPAEEGALIRLMAVCWKNGSLPDNDRELAILSRLGDDWPASSKIVRSCFYISRHKLYHKELKILHDKNKNWQVKSQKGGENSAKARRDKELAQIEVGKGGSNLVHTKEQPTGGNYNPNPINVIINNQQNQQSNTLGILTNGAKGKPLEVGVEKNLQDVLDLDCQIVEKRNLFLQEIQRSFYPISKRTEQTFKNIAAFFVRQAQSDSSKISYFIDAIEWARIAHIDGRKGRGEALFVETVKQRTGFGSQPRLLAAKV